MDAYSCLSGLSFGQAHFGGCDLGDKRLTARVVKTADRFMAHPGGTLPDKLNRNADLIGFYRLANNPKVTHARLIAAHAAHTRERMARCAGVVLVLHDTTELDFSGLDVADRGADINEFIEAVEQANDHYVIRSKTNRNIEIRDAGGKVRLAKLHDHAATLPVLGTRSVKVEHNNDQIKRTATVQVRCGPVTLRPRHCPRGESSGENLETFVVHVEELNPPGKVTPLKWILLTNVPAATFAEANQRIDWYACRPVIEELHKAMKTGCGIEMPQFTTGQGLRVSIAMQSVVATQLLRLRDLSPAPDAATRPANELIENDYIEAASNWRIDDVRSMSVLAFFMAVAKLGGHLNRRGDRPPGWLVLWRGWSKLQLLVEGAIGATRRRCV